MSELGDKIREQTAAWREQKAARQAGVAQELPEDHPYAKRKWSMEDVQPDAIPETTVDGLCEQIKRLMETSPSSPPPAPKLSWWRRLLSRPAVNHWVLKIRLVPGDDAMRRAMATGKLTIVLEAADKMDLATAKVACEAFAKS